MNKPWALKTWNNQKKAFLRTPALDHVFFDQVEIILNHDFFSKDLYTVSNVLMFLYSFICLSICMLCSDCLNQIFLKDVWCGDVWGVMRRWLSDCMISHFQRSSHIFQSVTLWWKTTFTLVTQSGTRQCHPTINIVICLILLDRLSYSVWFLEMI